MRVSVCECVRASVCASKRRCVCVCYLPGPTLVPGDLPGQELPHDHSKAVHVAAEGVAAARQDLWSQPAWVAGRHAAQDGRLLHHPRQIEITHLHPTLYSQTSLLPLPCCACLLYTPAGLDSVHVKSRKNLPSFSLSAAMVRSGMCGQSYRKSPFYYFFVSRVCFVTRLFCLAVAAALAVAVAVVVERSDLE